MEEIKEQPKEVEVKPTSLDVANRLHRQFPEDMSGIRVIAHVPYRDGCLYHRLYCPLATLQQNNVIEHFDTSNNIDVGQWIFKYPRCYNVMINQRIFGPVNNMVAKHFGWMYMLECDDDYWNITKLNPAHKWLAEKPQFLKYFSIAIPYAFGVIASTRTLVNRFEELGAKRVFYAPNGLNFDSFKDVDTTSHDGTIRIGWAGSAHHVDDMAQIVGVLREIKRERPNVELVFMNWQPQQLSGMTRFFKGGPPEQYQALMMKLPIDIAVAPLVDSKFNRSKSNLKWLEYSALGVPTVASDVEPYKEIEDGVTGFKARNCAEWKTILNTLIDNEELRRRVGEHSKEWCFNNYDLRRTATGLLNALHENMEYQKSIPDIEAKLKESVNNYKMEIGASKVIKKLRKKEGKKRAKRLANG